MKRLEIKQGDQYEIPLRITANGLPVDDTIAERVEFYLGPIRKLWEADGTGDVALVDERFLFPLTQEETLDMPAGAILAVDVRIKFVGGSVKGKKIPVATVRVSDARSEEVL